MAHTTSRGHGGKGGWQLKPMDPGMFGNGTTEYKEVSWVNERILQLVPSLKDASDFEATNVPDNLYLITLNHNNLSSSDELGYSQHMNGFNKIARGVEVWHFLGDALGKELAEKASAAIAKALGIPNRGAKATTDLYVVRNTYATFLLFEWIFLDNKEDYEAWLKNRDKAVIAALKAIGYQVEEEVKPVKPKPIIYQDTPGLYEALRTDNVYNDVDLKKKSSLELVKGQRIHLEDIIKRGKYTRAMIRINNDIRYVTMRDDYWKLIKKTKAKKIK